MKGAGRWARADRRLRSSLQVGLAKCNTHRGCKTGGRKRQFVTLTFTGGAAEVADAGIAAVGAARGAPTHL